MASHTTKTDPPRPRGGQNRERILSAAMDLFREQGYSGTNLTEVAERAGVTRPTIYSHFDSKAGLFRAVTRASAQQRVNEMSDLLPHSGPPREILIRFGEAFLERVLHPEARCWDRMAAAESMEHPEVGKAFYEAGPARVLRRLAEFLQEQTEAGRLHVDEPVRAAEQLLSLFLCLDVIRAQIGLPTVPPDQRERRCREAVDLFLATYGGPS